MATVASGLNGGAGYNSSDTITSTTLNDHVNDATVTDIGNADIASNAAIAVTKLATLLSGTVLGNKGAGNNNIDIVGTFGILKDDDSLGTSNTQGATQGNIKAYVDTKVANFPVTAPLGASPATCGTVTLPGGLILKFGQGSSTQDGAESFTFRSPNFPNNCFAVLVTGLEHTITAKSVSGFTMDRFNEINGTTTFEFLAIGN